MIGSDYYWNFVTGDTKRGEEGPITVDSNLGWLLSHPINGTLDQCCYILWFDYQRPKIPLSTESRQHSCEQRFLGDWIYRCQQFDSKSNANHLKLTSNETEIGTKSSCPGKTTSCLPCYQLYQLHLRSLHHKLRKEPSLLSEYNTVIQDQLKPGSSRRCQPKISQRSIAKLYLPHLAVIQKDHETTKVRVVYDGSEKASKHEKSLNDCLQTSLNHLLHVFNMFLDFCNNIVGLIVEIEKAFLMVGIRKVL